LASTFSNFFEKRTVDFKNTWSETKNKTDA